jgi:glycosyltransferase involved in cell wall biosynthesis
MQITNQQRKSVPKRSILILDTSYTLSMFRARQLEQALVSRNLGGYFTSVISVHPLAGLLESGINQFGDPVITMLDSTHVFVEGKIGVKSSWRFLFPLNLLLAQIRLVRLLLRMAREARVDVVRIGDPYYLGILGLVLARLLKVPLVVRVGFRFDELVRATGKPVMQRLFRFRWIEKVIERFVFARCNLIAGANEDNMRYALENGGRPEVATIFRYGNLIHANHWLQPNDRENPDPILAPLGLLDAKFALTIARLDPMKYVEDALRSVAELARRGHDFKWLVVGDGVLKGELESLSITLGVRNSIIFAGYQTQEWISSILPRAAVILSPHMGRALTEAALAGVPIVAYDYDWQREVVVNEKTGFLVAHEDWMGLADKLQFILTHPEDGKRMGKNARLRILEMMDPEKLVKHEINEYSKMLDKFREALQKSS